MDVKNFFLKIISGSKGTAIPPPVREAFNQQFDNPLNTEWSKVEDHYEAVFYKDELEHIARYKATGNFINLKVNLHLSAVPARVQETAQTHGELMNAIAIHENDLIEYELIVRDEELVRYFLLVSANGKVIDKERL